MIAATETLMRRETLEAPARIAEMLSYNEAAVADLGARLRASPPELVVTCARGSSDHAATYGKYLIETLVGVPVASAAPSVASLFEARVARGTALCLAISQSGRSPDLLASIAAQSAGGATVAALVNDESSPLATRADIMLPLRSGPETSVAATKSCLAAMAGLAALVAGWSQDAALTRAVADLPEALARAVATDWSAAIEPLLPVSQMFVIGRGYALGVAQECALKLKETCAIQAEPFSSAEVRHGPMTIVRDGFPVLALATSDAAGDDVIAASAEFSARGAAMLIAHAGGESGLAAAAGHPAIEPILMLASFYTMVEQLARARGRDPDRPPFLAKITETQ